MEDEEYDECDLIYIIGNEDYSKGEIIAKINNCIDNGADVNKIDENSYKTPLTFTAPIYSEGRFDLDITKLLLERGADINKFDGEGRTILHNAVVYGNIDFINFLIANGADVNANLPGGEGGSPLHSAVFYNIDSNNNSNINR
jgi:hypothetical protein